MTAAETTPATVPAVPWEDAYGRPHADIPRCRFITERRRARGIGKTLRTCTRRGTVQRGTEPVCQDGGPAQRPVWFCAQHDPDTARVRELAPDLLDAVRELLPLARAGVATIDAKDAAAAYRAGKTIGAATWLVERAEGRRGK